jgi:hypothetical protein
MRLPLILCWLIFGWSLLPVQAQLDPDELPRGAQAQYEAFKIAFFTQRLSLTSEEAKAFWPIYDRYTEAMSQLRRQGRAKQAEMRDAFPSGTEAQLETLSDAYIDIITSESGIRQEYHRAFKQVLPIRKVVLLYKAEQDFKRELLEEIQRRRQGRDWRNER